MLMINAKVSTSNLSYLCLSQNKQSSLNNFRIVFVIAFCLSKVKCLFDDKKYFDTQMISFVWKVISINNAQILRNIGLMEENP